MTSDIDDTWKGEDDRPAVDDELDPEAVTDTAPDPVVSLPVEANEADALEQAIAVPDDDDVDR